MSCHGEKSAGTSKALHCPVVELCFSSLGGKQSMEQSSFWINTGEWSKGSLSRTLPLSIYLRK